jgi:hypothetical protein
MPASLPIRATGNLEFPISNSGFSGTVPAVTASNYRVRRATLEDLGPLTVLWQSMNFSVEELGKRITEFQVAESAEGQFLGAVGLQIAQRQGLIHAEAYTDFGLTDYLRPLLWERLQSVAANHGLLRLWTQEQAPFWKHCGLAPADAEALELLPAAWRNLPPSWQTLKLKEDLDTIMAGDPEFALMMSAEKQRTARLMQRAKAMKVLATLIALGVLALALGATFYLMHKNPHLLRR